MKPLTRWTIAELGAAVEQALAVGYDGSRNGQVRDVPDARTIRYYASLGLVDPPAEMRGRTALYTRRHLLQVVAVKRLQAAGRALVEIQKELLGLTDAALEPIANVPADVEPSAVVGPPIPKPSAGAFWAVPPAPVAATPPAATARTLQIVPVAASLSLLIEAAEPPSPELTEALRAAAEPLLRLLALHNPDHTATDQEKP